MTRFDSLPVGYRAFTPTMDDIPRATEFFNLVEISEWGVPDFDQDEVTEEWADLDLSKSVVLVENQAGDLVASMTLINDNGVTWEAFGYVHPEHQRRGLGTWVTNWSEAMAEARAGETRDGYQIAMLNFISTVNEPARELLAGLGYDGSKVFRRMGIDLEERPEPVTWPSGLKLRPFVEGRDEQAFFDALETSFADHWSAAPRTFERWESSMKSGDYDTRLWLQLFDEDTIVAIGVGKIMSESGWISNVGVLPAYRRRGLAKRMLRELFGRYWDKGITRIGLGVDAENRHSAIDLYLGAGMHQTHGYEVNRKVLRDGLDWRDEDAQE
jgi:ribosomal protein S18 acetylase RimI-like enzyme